MRILVIEDEKLVRDQLQDNLQNLEHTVAVAASGREGLDLAEAGDFDVIVLDVGLPDMTGILVAEHLREAGDPTPVLFLSGMDSEEDIVSGLEAGGDAYMTKPFSVKELDARLRALRRRHTMERHVREAVRLTAGDLEMNRVARSVSRAGRTLHLTPVEFDLLATLMEAGGDVVSREELLRKVWGLDFHPQTVVLDTHLSNLRKKLRSAGPPLIENVRGSGYRIVSPDR
jgi:two-component system OmpR family response regulator